MKKYIFIALGLTVIIATFAFLSQSGSKPVVKEKTTSTTTNAQTTNLPSKDAFLAVLASKPELYTNGNNTTILAAVEPVYDWYVVTLRPKKDPKADWASAIFKADASGNLTLITGPATSFSTSTLDKNNVPLAVRDLLVVSDDE